MPTYHEARSVAHAVQDLITTHGPAVCQSSQEAYGLLVDCGFLLGLLQAGEPNNTQAFVRTYRVLDEFHSMALEEMEA